MFQRREEGWKQFKQPTREGDVTELLQEAQDQINEADAEDEVRGFIKTYESVLEIDPYNYEALWSLGRWLWFLGGFYVVNREEKKKYCMDSIKYCEQAMYTNPQFRSLVDGGEKVWNACRVLSEREMMPMYYWFSAVATYWKDCLGRLSQLININQIARANKLLTRMLEVDPTWDGGRPYFGSAVRLVRLPKFMGGDIDKAEELFKKAIEAGPSSIYPRFLRAQHLHTRKKDKEAFKNDLEWVIAQDPRKTDSPYPADVYFQREARKMLANIDDYF